MGRNCFHANINAQILKETADAMATNGVRDAVIRIDGSLQWVDQP